MAANPRAAIDVLRDLVDLARTPAKLMTVDRFERWSKVIAEAEALVQAEGPRQQTLGELLNG